MFDETYIRSKAWLVTEIVNHVLRPDKLSVEKIFLVGSYAQRKQNDWSDVDFLIQLTPSRGRLYPDWKQIQEINRRIGTNRIHCIYGSESAQRSMLEKHGKKYEYREITLSKESLC